VWIEKAYSVYIMTNRPRGVLYTGMTSVLPGRVLKHREGVFDGFTRKYNCRRLVWFETWREVSQAILREKRIKHWRRIWKIDLVEKLNPQWLDLWSSINGSVEPTSTGLGDLEVPDKPPALRPGSFRDDTPL